MKAQKIFLAGASGYLGKYIAAELQDKKYVTKVLVRNKSKFTASTDLTEVVNAEACKPGMLAGTMKDIDVLISTLGITKQKDGLTYMDVDYGANMNLLKEAKRSGVKKFIFVAAFNAEKLRHLKICEAKEKFVDELKTSGLDYCVIRPNGFFSDMSEFLKMAERGKILLFDDGNRTMNPIHGKDLAEICVDAIGSEEKNIEVGGPETFTHKEIAALAFLAADRKVKISYLPEWIRRTILWGARTFTSSKTYGPMEFFFSVLAMDMVAPGYGKYKLSEYFEKEVKKTERQVVM